MNIREFIDKMLDLYGVSKSVDILENYVVKTIKNYIDKKDSEENLVEFLGTLSFLYSKKQINSKRVEEFIRKISEFFPYSSNKLINHISNFMEMVFLYHKDLGNAYLDIMFNLSNVMEKDNMAILYRAFALPCYKNYMDHEYIESNIIYAWRYDYQMASFNYIYKEYFSAFRYINNALISCPDFLKNTYLQMKNDICKSFKNVEKPKIILN